MWRSTPRPWSRCCWAISSNAPPGSSRSSSSTRSSSDWSLILLLRRLKALGCAVLGVFAVTAATGLSWYAYTEHRLLIDPVLPSLAALLVYMGGSLINFVRTEAERRPGPHRVRPLLGPGGWCSSSWTTPRRCASAASGERPHFLFTDLAGFTSLTEGLEPDALVRLLNEYLDATCRIVLRHGGHHRQDRRRCAARHVQRPGGSAEPRRARDPVRAGTRRVLLPLRGRATARWA